MKRSFFFFLMALLPMMAMAAGNQCGPTAYYEYNSDTKVLSITGTGVLYDGENCSPWYDWCGESFLDEVQTITIGEGITRIGNKSFYSFNAVTSVTLPSTVTAIGNFAFCRCVKLETITIPENVNYIDKWAFSDCLKLKTVIFSGNTLPNLSSNLVFSDNAEGRRFYVPYGYSFADESNWGNYTGSFVICGSCGDNATFEQDMAAKELIISGTGAMTDYPYLDSAPWYVYPNHSPIEKVTVKEGITRIGNNAFYHLEEATSVSLPSTLLSIGNYAFSSWKKLTAVTIPNSVTSIETNAFDSNDALRTVTIGTGVTSIGADAFKGCTFVDDVYCNANPANLTWATSENQNFRINKGTKCHIPAGTERAWMANANFSTLNLTFTNGFSQSVTGSGVESDPYMIMTATDWNNMAGEFLLSDALKGKYFKQGANIELNYNVENNLTPVETFEGHYDGDGYYFYNVNMNRQGKLDAGTAALFINMVNSSSMKNVIVKRGIFNGQTNAAPLVYDVQGASLIQNCHVLKYVNVNSEGGYIAGGLVGNMTNDNNSSTITGCSSQAIVHAQSYAAGIIPAFRTGNINNCLYLGDVLTSKSGPASYMCKAVANSIDNAKVVNSYYITLGLSDPYATFKPNAIEDNSGFIELLEQRDNYLKDAKGGLLKSDYSYKLTFKEKALFLDNCWNTLVLPFTFVPNAQTVFSDWCEIRKLESATIENNTLNLTFSDLVTDNIEAGVPYIVRWEGNGGTLDPLEFEAQTIDKTDNSYDNGFTGDKRVRFIGTYDMVEFTDDTKAGVYVMGDNNKLQPVKSGAKLQAFSAYFKIGEDDAPAQINSININYGDGGETGVQEVQEFKGSKVQGFYTLDGRKVNGEPANNGIYISNGVKIVK